MASILDVAREAQVAPSTVSLVMNHRSRVKPETRDRVDQVIRRLGYRGRTQVDSQKIDRPQKAVRFGFMYSPEAVIDGMASQYCRELIHGVERSLHKAAATLNIMRGQAHASEDPMFLQHLENHELDGMLMFGSRPDDGYIEKIQQAKVPLVLFNRPMAHGRHSCVSVDFYNGGRQAADHLASLGHERIGLLLHTEPKRWPHELVHEGSVTALRAHDLEPVMDLSLPLNWQQANLKDACKQMLDAGVTAIQTSDMIAVPCIAALESMGLRVPDDISIVGFDDRGELSASGLEITTISYDKLRMGRMAGRMLQKLRHPNRGLSWLNAAVQTHLKEGQTTARSARKGNGL